MPESRFHHAARMTDQHAHRRLGGEDRGWVSIHHPFVSAAEAHDAWRGRRVLHRSQRVALDLHDGLDGWKSRPRSGAGGKPRNSAGLGPGPVRILLAFPRHTICVRPTSGIDDAQHTSNC